MGVPFVQFVAVNYIFDSARVRGIETFNVSAWVFYGGGGKEFIKALIRAFSAASPEVNTHQSFILWVASKENNLDLLFMLFNVTV